VEDRRPTFDEYYMAMAFVAATRSTCPRRATGAVIVADGRVIATGYNGAPRGLGHCPSEDRTGHPDCMEHGHCVRAVHAEVNAIIACAQGGASTQGATIYTTTFPCHRCIGPVINAGLARIVYAEEYKDPSHASNYHERSMRQANAAGIEITAVERPTESHDTRLLREALAEAEPYVIGAPDGDPDRDGIVRRIRYAQAKRT